MARLFTAGFESAHAASEDLTVTATGVTPAFVTTPVRSGTYALKCESGALNSTSFVTATLASPSTANTNYLSFWLRFAAWPSVQNSICAWAVGGLNVYDVRLGTNGALGLFNSSGSFIGGASGLAVDTWHNVQLGVKINAGATDYAELICNGTQAAITNVGSVSDSAITSAQVGLVALAPASYIVHIDDVIINDSTGSSYTSWPSTTSKVATLLPTADNARTGTVLWTGGAGGTTSLFDAVNNTPPVGVAIASDTDTSQIRHNGSGAGVYDATCAAYSTLTGLLATTDVLAAQVVAMVGEEVTTGTKLLRVEGVSGPVVASTADVDANVASVAVSTYSTGWTRLPTTTVTTQPASLATTPVIRVNRAETASRATSCCYLALVVEYVAAPVTFSPVDRDPRQSAIYRM